MILPRLCCLFALFTLPALADPAPPGEKCASGVANVRSAPFTSASITGVLTRGECVKELSTQGNWVLIESRGFKGYVFHTLLTDRANLTAIPDPAVPAQDKRIETSLRRWQSLTGHPYRRPDAIKEKIDDYEGNLSYLFRRCLRSGARLSGKMLVEIKIKANGNVGNVSILQSDIRDPKFENSVAREILTWKFRPVADSLGTMSVKYPLEFSLEE